MSQFTTRDQGSRGAQIGDGRLVASSPREDKSRYYEFTGQGSISDLLASVVLPKVWWPNGIRTRV